MNILAYCYGPTCEEKELFCKEFIEENKDYQIVSSSKIRQQISGDIFVKNKETEEKVIEQLIEECVKTFTKNKKRKNILINGLFLNQESRLKLINSLSDRHPISKITFILSLILKKKSNSPFVFESQLLNIILFII